MENKPVSFSKLSDEEKRKLFFTAKNNQKYLIIECKNNKQHDELLTLIKKDGRHDGFISFGGSFGIRLIDPNEGLREIIRNYSKAKVGVKLTEED